MKACWSTLERLGSPINPWTEKAALMVGDAVRGHVSAGGILPWRQRRGSRHAHTLGSRAPRLAKLEVHDTSLQNTAFALMCQGIKNGNWFGLTKLQVTNCHLTVDDLKIFTAALRNMKDAVFHRLRMIDLSGNPPLGASCGSFIAGVLWRPTMFPSLFCVVLDRCEVGDVGLSFILHALASWSTCAPRLQLLMNACEISDRGILLLVDYLKQQQIPLQSLSAEDNPGITDVGGLALIEAVSTMNSPVVALELEGIGMTREAVLAAATRTGKLIVMYHTEGSGFAGDTTRRFRLARREFKSLLTDG